MTRSRRWRLLRETSLDAVARVPASMPRRLVRGQNPRSASARRQCAAASCPTRETQITINGNIDVHVHSSSRSARFFQLILDVFILNTQELVFGWKVYDYVSYQRPVQRAGPAVRSSASFTLHLHAIRLREEASSDGHESS